MKKIVALVIIISLWLLVKDSIAIAGIPQELRLKTEEEKIITSKEIDWEVRKPDGTKENKGKIVYYKYISNEKVQDLKDEIVEKRTNNARFFRKNDAEIIGNFYIHNKFYQDGNDWYLIKDATTTVDAFKKQTRSEYKVLAADFYTGSGDGVVGNQYTSDVWATVRGASAGTYTRYALPTADLEVYRTADTLLYMINRLFFPIDTSSLGSGASISSATLYWYANAKSDGDADGYDYVTVIQTSQASNTQLVDGDFDQVGTTEGIDSGTRKTISAISTAGYTSQGLNATGIGFINKTGYTLLGLREGHDNADHAIATGADNYVTINLSESDGKDPYLSITYTSDTCTPPTTGDWIVNCNDNCFSSTDKFINGNIKFQYSGSFSVIEDSTIVAERVIYSTTTCPIIIKGNSKIITRELN